MTTRKIITAPKIKVCDVCGNEIKANEPHVGVYENVSTFNTLFFLEHVGCALGEVTETEVTGKE